MQRSDALLFIDKQMRTRWPRWEPTAEQIADWAVWLAPFDEETARNAVREHYGTNTYNKEPNARELRSILSNFKPRPRPKQSVGPETSTFVIYMGGGEGTLLPGYFFPVYTKDGAFVERAAENARLNRIEMYGGEWRVITEAKHGDMIRMRCELRKVAC